MSTEKPRHIDERITGIGLVELVAAFGSPADVDDLASLRSWGTGGKRQALWPVDRWASAVRGTAEADETIAAADRLRLSPPDVTGAGLGRSQRYGFHYLGWLRPAVSAWALTGDESYVRTFEDLFGQWVERRDGLVGEWPGLDLVWYSLGTWARAVLLLPALDSFGDALSDRAWVQVMGTLVGGARWAYDEHDAFRHGNWQLVCASQLLQLGVAYPRLAEAAQWVRRGRDRLVEHLDRDVQADGGHHERSPGYHSMCLEAVQLAAAVDQRYPHDGVAGHPRVAAMHAWLRQLTSDEGWAPHLQDSGIVWSGTLILRGGYLLDDPDLVRAARRWLPGDQFDREAAALPPHLDAERQARWADTVADAKPADPPTESVLLADSGYAVLRAPDVRVVVNCGPYVEHELESHSHRAVLDFVVDGWGRPLLWEAGGPPSYDDPRYQSWFQAGRGHNTVLVDGQDVGADRDAMVEVFSESPEVTVFTGSCRGNGVVHRRQLELVRSEPSHLVVRDTVAAEGEHTYELLLHAPAPWRAEDGSWRTDGSPGVRVRVDDVADTTVTFSTGEARIPNASSQSADYALLYTLSLTRRVGSFTTVVEPVADAQDLP